MIRRLAGMIAVAIVLTVLGLWAGQQLLGRDAAIADRRARERPTLLLLTSLPLVFGEDFTIDGAGSPVLDRLNRRYRVEPISVAAPDQLAKGRLLLMAQPLAQPPDDLVALDRWVRNGGRVLLLADPLLDWPSKRPLGDPLRPPAMFMDTGLLAHWGLTLTSPAQIGESPIRLAGTRLVTRSPGTLSGRSCRMDAGGAVATCRLGKGKAVVVADADFLDAPADSPDLDSLIRLLAGLESP